MWPLGALPLYRNMGEMRKEAFGLFFTQEHYTAFLPHGLHCTKWKAIQQTGQKTAALMLQQGQCPLAQQGAAEGTTMPS